MVPRRSCHLPIACPSCVLTRRFLHHISIHLTVRLDVWNASTPSNVTWKQRKQQVQVDIRPTCVYCEIIRNRSSSFFFKNARSKNNKLTRHLSLTYGDKFRTNMKNATINHIIYKNWINFITICNQYVIKSIFKNATEQIFSPDTCSFLWKSCLRSKLRSIR